MHKKIRVRRGITKYRYPIKRLNTCNFMNHVGMNNIVLCNIIDHPIYTIMNIPLYTINSCSTLRFGIDRISDKNLHLLPNRKLHFLHF